MRIRVWGSRKLIYAARAILVNYVLLNLHSYWAFVFVIPKAVIKKIIVICRNFLWDGKIISNRSPPITWDSMCESKRAVGLGVKDCEIWNLAAIGKLVWDVASKADKMWVKRVNHIYIKGVDWWAYTPANDDRWSWKKICQVRNKVAPAYLNDR